MLVTPETITLASATYAGGARFVAAGGGLPDRATTAALQTIAMGANINYCGICWDINGRYIWHAGGSVAITNLRKMDVATGLEDVAARIAFPVNIYSAIRTDNNVIICGGTGKVFEVDPVTSTILATINLAGAPAVFRAIRVPGVVGKYWTINSYTGTGATCLEYDAAGNLTGRSMAGTNYASLHVHPAFPGYFWTWQNGFAPRKIREADLAVITTYALAARTYGLVGEAWGSWSGCVDTQGRLYSWQSIAERVDRWTALGVADAFMLWTDPLRQFPWITWDAGCSHGQAVSLTDDDQWMGWIACVFPGTIRFNALRAQCVGPQTVVFNRAAATKPVTIRRLSFPGMPRNDGYYTPTTFATSVAGGAYVPAADGADTAIPLAVGQTLDVKVTYTLLGVPPGNDPYVESVKLEIEGCLRRPGYNEGYL